MSWLYFRYTEFKFFVLLLLVLLQTLHFMHDKYIYGNTYSSVLRTFFWCQCQLVKTQLSPNSYSSGQKRAKKVKEWPLPNCLLLLTCVNSWTLLRTLMLTAWAKSMSKAVLTTYQDEPGNVSWASICDEDKSQMTLVGHMQKDPRNSSQTGTVPQQGLGQQQAKPSWNNLQIQFWGPKKVCSRNIQKDL